MKSESGATEKAILDNNVSRHFLCRSGQPEVQGQGKKNKSDILLSTFFELFGGFQSL